jgi:hypothetical protein
LLDEPKASARMTFKKSGGIFNRLNPIASTAGTLYEATRKRLMMSRYSTPNCRAVHSLNLTALSSQICHAAYSRSYRVRFLTKFSIVLIVIKKNAQAEHPLQKNVIQDEPKNEPKTEPFF